jgi:hypothetical protein
MPSLHLQAAQVSFLAHATSKTILPIVLAAAQLAARNASQGTTVFDPTVRLFLPALIF